MSGAKSVQPDDGQLRPYGPQFQFLGDDARYYAFISGIGAGKTVAGILRMLKNVRDWNPGETGAVVAPTVPSMRTVIVPELERWNVLESCEFHRTKMYLEFPNGSKVVLQSADNERKIERLRGLNLSWFWIDEAATVDKYAWEILVGRLRTGQYRNGFVTTTPKGHNWVYERFVKDDPDDVVAITDVRSHDNPALPDDYREITDEYEGVFYEQEVLGKFRKFEGLVYPWFDPETHVIEDPPDTYDEAIYGVDWGHNNPGVVLAIVREGDTWVVADEVHARRMTVNDHAAEAERLVETWGEGPLYCDPSEPANIDTFNRNGLAARGAENDVTPGIQHVASQRDGLEVVRSCQNVRNEFNQYQYKDGGDDDRPVKQHDHAMDALRYALFTHAQAPTLTTRTARTNVKR